MANLVNTLICKELDSELTDAEGMVLVSFAGLTVAETEQVRGELADHGVKFRMVRNNLAQRVMAERGLEFPDDIYVGNTALAYGDAEQAILAAKVFAGPEVKKAGKVKFKAGLLEGEILDAADSQALADIPDRQTLQAKILGCVSGPGRGIVCAVSGVPSGLARVVQAHVDAGGPLEEAEAATETEAAQPGAESEQPQAETAAEAAAETEAAPVAPAEAEATAEEAPEGASEDAAGEEEA
ncbi:MAG: 50S ribosomal protein L10 [Planctomycetes bacterium]|jgi:large subunit ribosomal protein L10|nr:50S ribosomal protein L10 [Planctomycetota bacterium]MDP6410351.1 50S ribosomal protein L10 [Planctomycetota bacterium]